jgi:ParB-like chromosome segregation protein Spo0J
LSPPALPPSHPLADLFPPLPPEEYAALLDSIRANGQREAIMLHRDGRILDGKNRARVCAELGKPVASRTFEGKDSEALAYVLDLNLKRRHLTESQRAIIAKRLETLKQGRPGKDAILHVSRDDAARLLNVSPRSIASAGTVLKRAEPEIVAAVERGEMAVSTAAYIAAKPRKQQLGRLARDQRKIDGTHQQKDGFYRTPAATTRALLKVEKFPARVWEFACGDGAIAVVLIDAGYDVVSTDLVDRGYGEGGVDFLEQTEKRADAAITNPPFALDDDFALHAIGLGIRKFALLARLTWLEGVERHKRLFSQYKLARVWVFSARQTLWRGDDEAAEDDGGQTAYAWFVFELDHNGPWTGDWLPSGGDSL